MIRDAVVEKCYSPEMYRIMKLKRGNPVYLWRDGEFHCLSYTNQEDIYKDVNGRWTSKEAAELFLENYYLKKELEELKCTKVAKPECRTAKHGDLVDCEFDGVKYGARIVVSVGSKFMAYDRDGKLQSDEVQELYDSGFYKLIKNVFEEQKMTRAEKYPQIGQFAEEYENLCKKYLCLACDIGIICVQEANDKGWTVSNEMTDQLFNNELTNQLASANLQVKEN